MKMLLRLEDGVSETHIREIEKKARDLGLKPSVSVGKEKTMMSLSVKELDQIDFLMQMEGVKGIADTDKPYKLAARKHASERTIIDVKGLKIGGDEVIAMAGPCAIEGLEELRESAKVVKASGAKILRASAFKPRSSPYSFQGLGEEGLKIQRQVADELDLVIETEVMDPRDVALVEEYVDILRIGSRNMQNFDLLKEVGKCRKPVILKRGLSATIDEWLLAAEYIMAHGNHEVILCERGIRTFETATRNTLDLSAVALAKELTHLPVIVDPSHAAGRVDIITPLSKAAIAIGADGLLVEVHHDPENALCDGAQSLTSEEFELLMNECAPIANSIGRKMGK